MKKYLIESIGVFFLVLTIGLTGNPFAIGAVLAAMVYLGGYISGAHYNPAVTLAVWMQKKIAAPQACYYMLAQFIGALIAVSAVHAVRREEMMIAPAHDVTFGIALLIEIVFTFALVSVVLHTAFSKKTSGNSYYGLAIGLVLMVGALAGGHISGGAFNPVVGLAPNLLDFDAIGQNLANICLYLIAPFIGAAIASLTFSFTAEK